MSYECSAVLSCCPCPLSQLINTPYISLHVHSCVLPLTWITEGYTTMSGSARSLGHHMNSRTKDPTEDLGRMDAFKVVIDAARAAGAEQWLPVLSLLDALEAIEWAMILVRMGTEARACISWWRCLVRTKTQKLEHIKAYWLEANWKLCLELRQGADFQQVTRTIMTEQHALQAALQ